jgi:hypothetical protein
MYTEADKQLPEFDKHIMWDGQWDGLAHNIVWVYEAEEATCKSCLGFAVKEGERCARRLEQLY